MTDSLWTSRADDLLAQVASAAPTPGGGSVAAMSAAFGVALMRMAVAVTSDNSLAAHDDRLASAQRGFVVAADADRTAFDNVMAAYRLPRGSGAESLRRAGAIEAATVAATELPLVLLSEVADAVHIGRELEPVVKRRVASDVRAGCDLVLGAGWAAARTVDGNIAQLEALGSAEAGELRTRRDALVHRLGERR